MIKAIRLTSQRAGKHTQYVVHVELNSSNMDSWDTIRLRHVYNSDHKKANDVANAYAELAKAFGSPVEIEYKEIW